MFISCLFHEKENRIKRLMRAYMTHLPAQTNVFYLKVHNILAHKFLLFQAVHLALL